MCDDYIKYNNTCSSDKLYEIIRKHSNWYWSDDNRHREGRLDIVSARRGVVASAFKELNLPVDEAIELADQYSKVRIDNMYLFLHAHETLSYLRDKKKKLALITNGDSITQRDKITRFDLSSYFDCILVEGELGFGKPDERIFLYALEELNSQPGSTIMIGDNLKWDIAGPQALGIRAVWYDWKNVGLRESSQILPDYTIQSLNQIIDILNGCC